MNTATQLLAVTTLAFGIAGSALAQEATVFPDVKASAHAGVSRAEVRTDAIEALKAGELSEFAILNAEIDAGTQLSRQDVRQATLKALRNGSHTRINAEVQSLG